METEKDFYTENHYQLARIDTYQMQRGVVIGWLVVGCAMIVGGVLLGKTGLSVLGGFVWFFFGMRLWSKHRMLCPRCGGPFFGPFKLFMPFTQHCTKCGVSYFPERESDR